MANYVPLTVASTRREIETATSIVFSVPEALRETFLWRPGQHLNVRCVFNGEELRRSYSISSSPVDGPLRITVKRIRGGKVSNYLNDRVQAGQSLDVMPPAGSFCLDPDARLRRTHYFFSAGSGITPIFSMLQSVLLAEPHSYVNLLFGNRDAKSIIFYDALAQLSEGYAERLNVVHTLSKPGIWSSFRGWRGIVDEEAITRFIKEHPPYAQDAQYYICGPGSMNRAVQEALMRIDVPRNRIHSESYGGDVAVDHSVEGRAAEATVELAGEHLQVNVPRGRTILEALFEAGYRPPYSCQAGVCSTCRAQLLEGTVHLRARMALEDADIEQGAVLTCQAVATSEVLKLRFGS